VSIIYDGERSVHFNGVDLYFLELFTHTVTGRNDVILTEESTLVISTVLNWFC